ELQVLVAEPDAAVRHPLAQERLEDRAVDDVAVAHVEAVVPEGEVVDAVARVLRRQVALLDERPVRLDPERILLLAQDLELPLRRVEEPLPAVARIAQPDPGAGRADR